MKDILSHLFWSAVDFTERHFDCCWRLVIASIVVFAGLCFIFL